MRLLEREAHLSTLAEYADEARGGQGRMVLVGGEAGVGKSSLLEQLGHDLVDARWCWGACDGLFTPRPLAPLLDIAEQLDGELREACRRAAPREQLFRALLRELTAPGDFTVLAIEDVHWADEATLDLLRFVGRRLRDAPALLLVTYRDDGLVADDPLRVALGELSTQRTTRRLDLPPLSPSAVATLADGTGVEANTLHTLTGGNPFFVTEVLHAAVGGLPTSVRDAVLARVAGLSTDARQVLDIAALIGARIRPQFLESVSDASPETLDELVGCGVLTGDKGGLRFRHEIARRAVQSAIPPGRSATAHSAILHALLADGCDDDARLAFHAEGADDELVLEYATRAARRASELAAHREAAAQFERALRAASRTPRATLAGLYDELAQELALVDRWQDSADARQSALRLWRDVGDPVREGDTLRLLSRTMWRLCRGEEADQASEAALAVLEPLGPSPEQARAYANLANQRMNRGDFVEAVRLAQHARVVAEPLGLADVLSDALNTEACAAAAAGAGQDWARPLKHALEIAIEAGLDEQAGRAYANLYGQYCSTFRMAEGERFFVDGIAYCDEHDIVTFGTCIRGERTSVLEKLGRWDEAESLAGSLLSKAGPSPVNRLNPLISLGKVRARRGSDGVWTCLDEAIELADGVGEPAWIMLARTARAEARWLEGDDAGADCELAAADQAAALSGADERSAAAAWHHRIDSSRGPEVGVVEPFASEVADDHTRAAKLWDELGFRYHAALALLDSTAEAHLREALARLEDLGAEAAARLARQKMRRLHISSIPNGRRTTTKKHPAGLTRREHEVLELLCDGLTNNEISSRLFVSVKTVDHHVSAVLGKLGVRSRKVVAAEAVRLGLLDTRWGVGRAI